MDRRLDLHRSTGSGTVLACTSLRECEPPSSRAEAKKNVVLAIGALAGVLGNTRSVCRKSYIHLATIEAYESGVMAGAKRPAAKAARNGGLRQDEAMTLALLRQCEKQGSAAKAA